METTPHLSDGQRVRGRFRKRLISVVLVIVAVGGVAGVGAVVGGRSRDHHWEPRYREAVARADRWKASSLEWQESSTAFKQDSLSYHNQLNDLQRQVTQSVGDLDRPSFSLWNSCGSLFTGCPLSPGQEYIGGVPDTFTYNVSFTATVPVTVWIMDVHNFICWETHYCAWRAVGWKNRTSVSNGVFHLAEGCAGYFAVFFSSRYGTLYPDVRVIRHPATRATGACR